MKKKFLVELRSLEDPCPVVHEMVRPLGVVDDLKPFCRDLRSRGGGGSHLAL